MTPQTGPAEPQTDETRTDGVPDSQDGIDDLSGKTYDITLHRTELIPGANGARINAEAVGDYTIGGEAS